MSRALAVVAVCCVSVGCDPHYPYLTLNITPPVAARADGESVYVFRVELERHGAGSNIAWYGMTPLRLWSGTVPPQVVPGINVLSCHGTRQDVVVRMYRPGYRLVEVESWTLPRDVTWVPAESLEE